MDDRVVEFIRGLRAAGVRVSLAESVDAMKGIEALGVVNKDIFHSLLRSTLVKERDDFPAFDELFTIYFGSGGRPLQNAMEDMSPEDQELLKAAMQALSGRLQQLMEWLTSGQGPTKEELEELARRAGTQWANNPQEAMGDTAHDAANGVCPLGRTNSANAPTFARDGHEPGGHRKVDGSSGC